MLILMTKLEFIFITVVCYNERFLGVLYQDRIHEMQSMRRFVLCYTENTYKKPSQVRLDMELCRYCIEIWIQYAIFIYSPFILGNSIPNCLSLTDSKNIS